MKKSDDTLTQQRHDFDARHKVKTAIKKMEALKTESKAPSPWNAAIERCINVTKEAL